VREAIADAQRLVDTQPRSPSSFTQLGRALCHADRYPDAAAALLGALELQPDDSEARLRFDQVLEVIRRHRTYLHAPLKRDRPAAQLHAPLKRDRPAAQSTMTARSSLVDMQTVRTSRFPRTPPMEMTRCQAPPMPSVETIDPKHSTVLIR
jgi:hypothetical protein